MFYIKESGGFRYRELSVLDALALPEAADDADAETKAEVGQKRIAHVLSSCLLDGSGDRLFATPQEAFAGIPASKYSVALEAYAEIMRMSGMWASESDSKNE